MLALLGAWVVAMLPAASASAHWAHPVSFGNGQVSVPAGVAVDQSSGEVYVGNVYFIGNDKFNAAHDLLSPPSPFGGERVFSGIALNPANGDVYAVDGSNQAIDTYDPSSGELLSSFALSGSANFFGAYTVVQIASDSVGNVYVPNAPNNEIQVFGPSGEAPSGGVAATIAGAGANSLKAPEGVAVDSSGHVWVADSGDNRIEEFQTDGTFVREISAPGVQAVAVDASGDVFASVDDSSGAHVLEYDSSGTQIDDFGLGTLEESFIHTPNSVAVDNVRGIVYVADGGKNAVEAFTTWGVVSGSASALSETGATLSGTVEVEGSPPTVSSCQFEYGPNSSYGQTASCSPAGPYASTTAVGAQLSGLTPGATYHFRVSAANAYMTSYGEDRTFMTFGPPGVESPSSNVSLRSGVWRAGLTAQINPYGYQTTCEVQYVDEATFQRTGYADAASVPCAAALGSGFGDQVASAALSGLSAGTVYHYRFVATNQAGTTDGSDQTLATFGVSGFSLAALDQGGQPYTQAGGHPYELTTSFEINPTTPGGSSPNANVKDIETELPPGLLGDPTATPRCSRYDFGRFQCSASAQIGVMRLNGEAFPLFNLVPPAGMPAEFGALVNGVVAAYIDTKVRTGGDYGITADVVNASAMRGVRTVSLTLWGVPAQASHDAERQCPYPSADHLNYQAPPCASTAPLRPFLRNPTSCMGVQSALISVDSWQEPGNFVRANSQMPAMDGCEKLDFNPSLTVVPETSAADSPMGLSIDLHVPQNANPVGLAEADLKDAVLTLPAGVSVNPAGAGGLESCSAAQIDLKGSEPASCPQGSEIGTVELDTPLVDHPLHGGVYVARQGENPFGSLLAIYIALDDPQSGVVLKLAGEVALDEHTGQLTTSFRENPQLPFEDLKIYLFGGARAALLTPGACGSYTAVSSLTPWSAGAASQGATPSHSFQVASGSGGSPCSAPGFAPSLVAGTLSNRAGAFSPFSLTLSRRDGEQRLGAVAVELPPGVAGMLSGVPLCGDAQASAGDCPAASQIGHVTVLAGAGAMPIALPEGGKPQDPVYLTGPYGGAPFGLAIVVPAEAGPFNLDQGGRPVVVRAGIHVDPHTAQVSILSDPLPLMLQGIPLDIRAVNIAIDRERFMLNPTSCQPMSVDGTAWSAQGASAPLSSRFQAAECRDLPFKPSLTAVTSAHTSRMRGASLHVTLRSGAEQANIASVEVLLPKRLPSRLATLKLACAATQFLANPAGCPAGSKVGSAVAYTPLLPVPMTGPAYFVSHGGAAFPDLVLVLQGDGVTIQLTGRTFIDKAGITSTTFASIPDVPVTRFDLRLPEGPHSALAARGSLCRRAPLSMPTTILAQNGVRVRRDTRVAVAGCRAHRHHPHRASRRHGKRAGR
jgi:streptogramin lyase